MTRRSGEGTGRGRSRSASTTLKIAVLAPIPRASDNTAAVERIGEARNPRSASRTSCIGPPVPRNRGHRAHGSRNGATEPTKEDGRQNSFSFSLLAPLLRFDIRGLDGLAPLPDCLGFLPLRTLTRAEGPIPADERERGAEHRDDQHEPRFILSGPVESIRSPHSAFGGLSLHQSAAPGAARRRRACRPCPSTRRRCSE